MKKLIAISVVFALVAGAAFAADIGVEVIGMTDIIKGNTAKAYYDDGSKKPNDVGAGGWPGGLKRTRITGSGENDEGTFGGHFRVEKYGTGEGLGIDGNAWWKPVEQVRFRLGNNPDGDFAADGVARWGFYQVGGDVGVPKEEWKFGASFYEGWGANGGLLTLTPTDGLEINWGIPYSMGGKAQDVYMSSTLQIAYTAEGLGKFALTYKGGKGNREEGKAIDVAAVANRVSNINDFTNGTQLYVDSACTTKATDAAKEAAFNSGTFNGFFVKGSPAGSKGLEYIHDPSTIWVFAGLTMIENLEIDIGFGYIFPVSGKMIKGKYHQPWDGDDEGLDYSMAEGSYSAPMAIGLGAHYNGGDFGVKARTQLKFGGKIAEKDVDAYKIPMNLVFDVLPYYNINESLSFLFSAGIDYTAKSGNEGDKEIDYAKVGFHVTPYITVKSSWWAPNLYAGIDIRTNGKKVADPTDKKALEKDGSAVTSWSVPIGIVFAF